jgi:hypothetical protein
MRRFPPVHQSDKTNESNKDDQGSPRLHRQVGHILHNLVKGLHVHPPISGLVEEFPPSLDSGENCIHLPPPPLPVCTIHTVPSSMTLLCHMAGEWLVVLLYM